MASLQGRHTLQKCLGRQHATRPLPVSSNKCCQQPHLPQRILLSPVTATMGRGGNDEDYATVAAKLDQLYKLQPITADELKQLVMDKWGRAYEIRLNRRDRRMYVQVMWKFLGQQSFHLTEEEYYMQLDAVAHFLNEWGAADTVRSGIQSARARGPGYTGGTSARCISIPLDVDLSGARSGEWN